MLITGRLFDLVIKTKDDAHALVVQALNASHALALGAQANEIAALKKTLEDLNTQLRYERARADNLVDRLLIRDAKVAAVAPAAVEIAKFKDEQAVKKLHAVFDQLNDIATEIPARETRAFDMAGGTAVAAHV